MKAYIFRVELIDSNPLIWRKIIVPAGVTFRRLHDSIQAVMNFCGYIDEYYHLFEFNLEEVLVTNNDAAREEHAYFKKNRKRFEENLMAIPEQFIEVEKDRIKRMEKSVRNPKSLKIDKYVEVGVEIEYIYDFGDYWRFRIVCEEIVEDYYFGFPTLLDGAETAPPEDVGGIPGYYEFLKVYSNPKHPEYAETVSWATGKAYWEYDIERINAKLKHLKFKKTEWDKVNHDNYKIISDKYRKGKD